MLSFFSKLGYIISALSVARAVTVMVHILCLHPRSLIMLSCRVTNGVWTNETLTAALENHIANVAGRYKGQLYAWGTHLSILISNHYGIFPNPISVVRCCQ